MSPLLYIPQASFHSTVFTENNLPFLTELLHPAVAVWYDLGLQLRVSHADLTTIEQGMPANPKGCLRQMLVAWLNLASPTAECASALEAALSTESVGKSRLSAIVKMKCAAYSYT